MSFREMKDDEEIITRASPTDIKRVRKIRKITQEGLAKLLKMDRVTIGRWESGMRECKGHIAEKVLKLATARTKVAIATISPTLIKKIRKRLDLTRKQFAKICNIDITTVCAWEDGSVPCSGEAAQLVNIHRRAAKLNERAADFEVEEEPIRKSEKRRRRS
jgi:DNA-binding transcriptional regulator YiaG